MRLYHILLFLILGTATLHAQQPTRSELEKKKANLLNEIAETSNSWKPQKKTRKQQWANYRRLPPSLMPVKS